MFQVPHVFGRNVRRPRRTGRIRQLRRWQRRRDGQQRQLRPFRRLHVARVDDRGPRERVLGGRPGRGPRGGGGHLQAVGLRVVPEPVPGEPGAAEELRENEAVHTEQGERGAAHVRPDVRDETPEEQRGGQEVQGRQAPEVHREPDQRHVPHEKGQRTERDQKTAADVHVTTDTGCRGTSGAKWIRPF